MAGVIQKGDVLMDAEADDNDILVFQKMTDLLIVIRKAMRITEAGERIGQFDSLSVLRIAQKERGVRVDDDVLLFQNAKLLIGSDITEGTDLSFPSLAVGAFRIKEDVVHASIVIFTIRRDNRKDSILTEKNGIFLIGKEKVYNGHMHENPFPEGLKACIFDLDGTLVDSMKVWQNVDQQFFLSKGILLPDDYQKAISHMSFRQIAQYTIERFHLTETPEDVIEIWMGIAKAEYAFHIKAKKNARLLLSYLKSKGIKTALATSNQESLYLPCLENNKLLEFFDCLEDTNRLKTSKSEPTIYLELSKRFGSKPSQCLVFEDILVAIQAAHKASFPVIGVKDDSSRKDWGKIKKETLRFVSDFEEVLVFLKKYI